MPSALRDASVNVWLWTGEDAMRKLIVSEFMTLDGVMEDPGGAEGFTHGGWTWTYQEEAIGKVKFDELMASDALLLGRVTYEGFARAWPGRTDEEGFADHMNSMAKYVVSTTLTDAAWNNSTIIAADVADEVARLKAQPGQDILVAGSATLIRSLIAHDLVDEYTLLVFPLTLGTGKRLFQEDALTKLRLIEARPFASGVTLLRYQTARETK